MVKVDDLVVGDVITVDCMVIDVDLVESVGRTGFALVDLQLLGGDDPAPYEENIYLFDISQEELDASNAKVVASSGGSDAV